MTSEPTIICPNCKTEIKLTESLAAPQCWYSALAFFASKAKGVIYG